jgi:hypothetical protein
MIYNTQLFSLINKRPESVKVILRLAIKKISEMLPSERETNSVVNFLSKIQDANNAVIKHQTTVFLEDELFARGKGLAYLAAMINNYGKNQESIAKMERKRLGSVPPRRN